MAEFTAAVENYDRFMGRYATGLAPKFADAAGVRAGMRVLDVGCGPGALAVELAGRVGEDNVAAIDPAPQFAAACQARIPGADVREGVAESLPWDDGTFDAAMCSLVVAWMSDADQGLGEMARVTKPGGAVAAAMWDIPGGGLQMLRRHARDERRLRRLRRLLGAVHRRRRSRHRRLLRFARRCRQGDPARHRARLPARGPVHAVGARLARAGNRSGLRRSFKTKGHLDDAETPSLARRLERPQ